MQYRLSLNFMCLETILMLPQGIFLRKILHLATNDSVYFFNVSDFQGGVQ